MLKSRLPTITAEMHARVEAAVEVGAHGIVEEAQSRVPVSSGKLRDAIHVDRQADGVHVVAGDMDAWYGHLVEHGTARTPPRPFLVPAFESKRDDLLTEVRAALKGLG